MPSLRLGDSLPGEAGIHASGAGGVRLAVGRTLRWPLAVSWFSRPTANGQRLLIHILPLLELLDSGLQVLLVVVAGRLRQGELCVLERFLVIADRGVAAGEADVDRPFIRMPFGVQLPYAECFLLLSLLQQRSRVLMQLDRSGCRQVDRLLARLRRIGFHSAGGLRVAERHQRGEVFLTGE